MFVFFAAISRSYTNKVNVLFSRQKHGCTAIDIAYYNVFMLRDCAAVNRIDRILFYAQISHATYGNKFRIVFNVVPFARYELVLHLEALNVIT